MLKCVGTTGSGPMLLLGLTQENTERLHRGEPIRFNLADIGGPERLPSISVVIIAGKTNREILAELKKQGLVDAETQAQIGPGKRGG